MKIDPKLRSPLLAVALAASAASAFAAYTSSFVPNVVGEPPATRPAESPDAKAEAMGLEPHETIVSEEPAAAPAPAPVARPVAQVPVEPAITIEKPRLTEDQRIQADVMDVLATNPTLSGKIGVVSEDSVVTLTGYTLTSGQAWRAGRDAGRVRGVRHVVNEIRPRVGGITS
jgi:osmotically-inducible protein OsmY